MPGTGRFTLRAASTAAIIIPAGIMANWRTLTQIHPAGSPRQIVGKMCENYVWTAWEAGARQLGSDKVKSTHAIETRMETTTSQVQLNHPLAKQWGRRCSENSSFRCMRQLPSVWHTDYADIEDIVAKLNVPFSIFLHFFKV